MRRTRPTAVLLAVVVAAAAALTVGCDAAPGPTTVVHDPAPRWAPPASTPDVAPGRPRSATILMGGDLLWHNTVWFSAAEDRARTGAGDRFDFDPMFAALRPDIRAADLAICHEEVPFAAPGDPVRSYPVFAAPRQIAPWIASMGWDVCTTASNHSLDAGIAGIVETADQLDRAGVRHVGTFRTPAERREPVVVDTDPGVRVGIVAATYGLNGLVLPPGREWAVSQLGDADDLLAQARRARRAGADIVIAHVHWGTEYEPLPDAEQVALADRLTGSPDIDVVLGEHAHVVQPITRVNGKWVVYGMGNMIAQNEAHRFATYEGITVRFTVVERRHRWRVGAMSYLPTAWGHHSPGNPIRIRRATGAHLATVRAAVNGLGGNRGLVER